MPEKQISIRFTPEQIGQATVDRIITYWKNGTRISDIIRRLNPGRPAENTLAFVDIYAVINQAKKRGAVTQRNKHKNELTIHQFQKLFASWKLGATLAVLKNEIGEPQKNFSIESVVKSLNRRWKEERDNRKEEVATDFVSQVVSTFNHILTFAQRMHVDDKECLVIYLDSVPPKYRKIFEKYPDLGIYLQSLGCEPETHEGLSLDEIAPETQKESEEPNGQELSSGKQDEQEQPEDELETDFHHGDEGHPRMPGEEIR